MFPRGRHRTGWMGMALCLSLWGTLGGAEVPRASTLIISKVTHNPKKHYKTLKPLVDYVASHLSEFGIREGAVLMAKDNPQMLTYLIEGKVDWVTETPFSALLFAETTGAEIILRRWKEGAATYRCVFITRKDSGIQSLADLKGKTIAFEDSGSATAYFVPLGVLKNHGLGVVALSSPRTAPPPGRVGYAFAGGELNITAWVHKGLTAAGALSDQVWDDPDKVPPPFKKDLTWLYQTQSFPRAVEVLRKGLNARLKQRIKGILLQAHDDPTAQAPLRAYQKTARFDELVGEAQAGMDETRRFLNAIRTELR